MFEASTDHFIFFNGKVIELEVGSKASPCTKTCSNTPDRTEQSRLHIKRWQETLVEPFDFTPVGIDTGPRVRQLDFLAVEAARDSR